MRFFKVNEDDVNESGLLTKKLYINFDIPDNEEIKIEVDFLFKKAESKRQECISEYGNLKKNINPLTVIQFSNNENDYIEDVRKKLEYMGYSLNDGIVANWMSGLHDNISDITENNSCVSYVFTKQAIATGWNCQRAKILIILRENSIQSFVIQTVDRIRRTAERMHYNNDILDNSYIYTTDKEYAEALKKEINMLLMKNY